MEIPAVYFNNVTVCVFHITAHDTPETIHFWPVNKAPQLDSCTIAK